MELGPRVGVGATANIYALDDGWVVKLFENGTTRETVEREVDNTRVAAVTGISAPSVREVVRVNGRYGIVLSRVEGPPILGTLRTPVARRRLCPAACAAPRLDSRAVGSLVAAAP